MNEYLLFIVSSKQNADDELEIALDLLTTNTTYFFREEDHFRILTTLILPELLKQERHASTGKLKIWSAASSEGAEAYSIAMTLASAQRLKPGRFDFSIIGSDISERMIERAEKAVYPMEQLAVVPADLAALFIMKGTDKETSGLGRLNAEIRSKVKFAYINLIEKSYPIDRDIDVVFLRNVLIYFSQQDQDAVVERIAGHIQKGGYLVVGHTESMAVRSSNFEQVKPTIFRKI